MLCSLTPGRSDEAEQVWVWEYETDEGAHDLYMDQGEEIRFRVVDELFLDTSPTGPTKEPEAPVNTASAVPAAAPDNGTQKKESPYTLVVRETTHTRTHALGENEISNLRQLKSVLNMIKLMLI